MISKHFCLDGEERLGQELDCPKCRALLLNSFRQAPDAPYTPGERCTPGETCTDETPCTEHYHHPRKDRS